MTHSGGTSLCVGLVGTSREINGVPSSRDQLVRLELPAEFDAEKIDLAVNDLQVILSSLQEYRREHLELQNALVQQDFRKVSELLSTVGITEERLRGQGGQVWGLVIAIAVACAVLLSSDNPR